MSFIGSRPHDGVIQEPSPWSRVSTVHPNMPPIKSYVEAAADYYVVRPTSSFVLAPSDQFVRWNTTWGAAPSSCPLTRTMGSLAQLYGFEDKTTWSPSCWDLNCPEPGQKPGSVADPFNPARTAFVPYDSRTTMYESTGRCLSACAASCSGPGDTTKCQIACANKCLQPVGLGAAFYGNDDVDSRTCTSLCSDRCSGRPNFNQCLFECVDDCKNSKTSSYSKPADHLECKDNCSARCGASNNVNDCFLPCSNNCH